MEIPMPDLLSALQSAKEGSAELDAAVLRECGWKRIADEHDWRVIWQPPDGSDACSPRPTRLLDDVVRMIEAEGLYIAGVSRLGSTGEYLGALQDNEGRPGFAPYQGKHMCLRLALCIALVRAIQARKDAP
jgi:hypothetical protein